MNYAMFLYIDPATGGMLFTILFGVLSAVMYFVRSIFIKIKFSVGKTKKNKDSTIKLPIVIFSDHKRYWNIYEPICDGLEACGQKAYYYTMSEDDPAFKKGYNSITCEYIGNGNKAFSKMNFLKAYLVFSTTPSLDVFQWKRSKDVDCYIHIPHMANDITTYKMFGIDYFDSILVSGEYQINQIRQLEQLRKLPKKEIILAGIPYLDEMKKRLEAENFNSHSDKNKTVNVLLASSWGINSILNRFGERIIDALVDTGYHVIIRPHPQSFTSEKELINRLMKKYDKDSGVEWNKDNDNYEILKKSDILISDFSGVIFDFSLVFNKPIIYTDIEFDKGSYDCAWLEEDLWSFTILPYIGKALNDNNIHEIKTMIDDCLNNPCFEQGREKARLEAWANIGKGTDITVDYIIKKYNELKS